jgi:hypothetical protein
VIRFILCDVDASPDLRKHHQPQVIVLQERGAIGDGLRTVLNLVDERNGINSAVFFGRIVFTIKTKLILSGEKITVNTYFKERLRAVIRVICEIGAEFAGVLRRDVECCTERARLAKDLGPAWSVTEAMDTGRHVLIRFDQALDIQGWQGFTVRVNKATGRVTTQAA